MSDFIGHECGLALVRLQQNLSYYRQHYHDAAWGLRRLYLLMEKQHNRGQDGAGVATVKFDMPPGEHFFQSHRSDKHNALERVFDVVMQELNQLETDDDLDHTDLQLKQKCDFLGEVHLGHLRYGTHSGRSLSLCHPYVRHNATASRTLAIAGNFNMTNSTELFDQLVADGLNPVGDSDTQVILERIGYFLDAEHDYLRSTMGLESFLGLTGRELATSVASELDLVRILSKASTNWDGGYAFIGMLGNGDSFLCRDPAGIRPLFYYADDEVVAAASERVALTNVFNVETDRVNPVNPGHLLVIKRDGTILHKPFTEPLPTRQCTFERVYFSRGNDPDIYQERKSLGRHLAPRVLQALNNDVENAVFSYIPNTAESAYVGLIESIDQELRKQHAEELWRRIETGNADRADVDRLVNGRLRAEKIAHKDQRLRTFITHDDARRDLVMHIYDITRDVVKPDDALVVVDDSIVRGTTLRESIITMLSRLNPKQIIVVSSAPPIMYPDCYGIDMSQLGRFIAFEAAIALVKDRGEERLLDEVENRCRSQADWKPSKMINHVADIYGLFSLEEISAKIAQLVRPKTLVWDGRITVIYQTIDGLRQSMPGHTGDWYFTGDYPTPGGVRVLNTSYLRWREHNECRAY